MRLHLSCKSSLLALAALLLAAQADAARRFAEVGVGRGLDAAVIPAMLVDRDGFLWVGSREGLFRYDGYQAVAYLPDANQPGHISDVDVRSLFEADDGALWVSTNTGGLNRRDPRTGLFAQFHHVSADPRSLSDESVYGVGQDADGRVWVGTQKGLNRLDADGRGFTRYFHERGKATSLAHDWVYTLHLGPSKRLWIGTVGGGIDRWDDATGTFEHFELSRLTGGPPALDDVFAIHEAPDGRVWAGTRQGLVELDPARREARLFDMADAGGVQPLVTAMHADRAGRLWLATHAHGVLVVDLAARSWVRAHRSSIGAPGNLPAQPQLSLASTGNTLFVGTWGSGVYRTPLEEPSFRLLSSTTDGPGLRNKNVTAVLGGAEPGRPWVGSFGGGPQRVDVAAGTVFPTVREATDPIHITGVISLAMANDGSLFAGATDGLYRFAANGQSLGTDRHAEDRPAGIGAGYVGALLAAQQSGLWVGVGGSGLFFRDPQGAQFHSYHHDPATGDSLSGDYITALATGGAGRLWVGTRSNGLNLCRIEPWTCQRFDGHEAGQLDLGHHHVTALHRDPGGALWVATDGGGVSRVLESPDGLVTGFERWGTSRGLLNDGIMAVESDDDGSLWLSTRHGLSRLDPTTGRVVNQVAESGLPASHFNTGASSSDAGFLYFGSVDGLLSVPRGTPMRLRPPAPLRITSIERLARGGEQPLPSTELRDGFSTALGDVLAVEFAVLDFAETPHEYAYRLRADDAWTPLGRRRQLTFFGLAAGHYAFEVRGRDAFGQWSTSPALPFQVVPPFWMTGWFRVLLLVAAGLLVHGLQSLRLRRLRRRNLVLERLEQQRERALAQATRSRRELEEAYAGLRQLTGRLESAKEEERSHLSRELHDEFGQTLTAAKINLQMLRSSSADPSVVQRLEESVGMVDGMIQQARNIALGLRPPLLDEAGLVPALDHHLKSLAGRCGIRIDFEASPAAADIPATLNTTVFRVVQEAVCNALRHARAAVIGVALQGEPGSMRLLIEDDGVGFDPEAVQQRAKRGEHLGLLGMTERVRNAGGTITLDSQPGAGSRIAVRIPFARPAAVAVAETGSPA
jgi:signal transduction histidine kinase/ligand-binding sensor domain-containing protein